MELIKRSENISVARSELLHQSGPVTNVCRFFQGTGPDSYKLFFQISFVIVSNESFSGYRHKLVSPFTLVSINSNWR